MADVQFNEPSYGTRNGPKRSGLAQFVISLGLAKDDAGAQKALLVLLLLVILATLFVLFRYPLF
jgi:hypothetical protein